MNEGTFMYWMMAPLTRPTRAPRSSVAATVRPTGRPQTFAMKPVAVEARPTTNPRERSIPPVMRTIVIPRTAMAGIADCLTMTAALSTEAKLRTNTIPTSARRTRMTALPLFKVVLLALVAIVLVRNFASVEDRKSTRLNSSHQISSYAVFCLETKRDDGRIDDDGAGVPGAHGRAGGHLRPRPPPTPPPPQPQLTPAAHSPPHNTTPSSPHTSP